MRLTSLSSGSSGNCIYVGSDTTHLLIDAGCSAKRIEEGLHSLELSLAEIDAIFLTHEHSDHIASLHTLIRRHEIPVYLTSGTKEGVLESLRAGSKQKLLTSMQFDSLMHVVRADEKVLLKDLCINPMRIRHDAKEPVAYRVSCGAGVSRKRVAVATDMGCYDDYTVESLSGMDALLIEANHDVRMLQTGPYPYPLKQRILSDTGHLSNETSGELLTKLLHDRLKGILLGHLSAHNNYPDLAYETVRLAIEMGDVPYKGGDFPLYVAVRNGVSTTIHV